MPNPDHHWRGRGWPHWCCWRWPVGCSSSCAHGARARPSVELVDQWMPAHRAPPGKRDDPGGNDDMTNLRSVARPTGKVAIAGQGHVGLSIAMRAVEVGTTWSAMNPT